MHSSEVDEKALANDLKNSAADETSSDDVGSDIDYDEAYTKREQRAIIHRVDRRLVTVCGILYCFSLIDRGNLGAASIAGMTKDLHLDVGARYSIVVLIFYPFYVLSQPPSMVAIRKLGPRFFLSVIALIWGATEIGFGFVQKWTSMIGTRIVLGVLEAGLYPSIVYLLATWYSRYDVGKRYSAFYIIGCIASAFSGILGYGLMQMDGVGGLRGWRWIFVMEGLVTCIIAFFAYFLVVDFPEKAHESWKFLNKQEVDFIVRRVNKDRGDAIPESFTLKRFLTPALDIKLWILGLISFFIITVTTAVSVYLPIILKNGLGFSVAAAQLGVAPPYGLAIILMVISAWVGDHFHVRGPILIANALISLIGLPIMAFSTHTGARYFGVFLVTAGANANIPVSLAYQANNVRGQWKRALCSALFVGLGGVGGISGGTIFRTQDAPKYVPGVSAAIACNGLVILFVLGLSGWYMRCNRLAKQGKRVNEGLEGFMYTI